MLFRRGSTVIFLTIGIFAWSALPGAAQSVQHAGEHFVASSHTTQEGGMAVLSAALALRHVPAETDCSHLVHDVYERAGLPYSYLTSRELFVGAPPFIRVKHPQPGDVIVWPGHAGIVVSPKEHTFYAAFTSGLGVERYDSDYWVRRGHPRFFRYSKHATLQAAASYPGSHVQTFSDWDISDPQPAVSTPSPKVVQAPFPASIVIGNSDRPTPLAAQQAALQHFARVAEILSSENVNKPAQSIIVFDEFQVRKLHVKGNTGWAEVQFKEPSSIIAGKVNLKKHTEKIRWPLSHFADGSWEMTPTSGTIYLSRDAATRFLAHRLAMLTDQSHQGNSTERAGLARVLATLLEQPD